MPFAARFAGTCANCGKPIHIGDNIAWSRRAERGKRVYHADCSHPDAKPDEPTEADYAPLETSSVDSELSRLKGMLETLIAKKSVIKTKPAVPMAKPVASALHPNAAWYDIFEQVLPLTNRILLIGPPSSGKSTTAMLAGGIKLRITMTETTSREDLIGMFHLISGETKWIDGPFTTAMRHGQPILIDEIDRYSPEAASLLYSLIDDKPHVSLPTGELVHAKEGYRVVMTSNEAIETLPPAVQDRIECILIANVPHQAALADLPKAQAEMVRRYYKTLPVPQLRLGPTVRRMRAFHNLTNNGGIPAQIAASLVFGEQAAKEVLSAITSSEGTTC